VIVGVNKYKLAKEDPIEILEVDNVAVRDNQIKRLKRSGPGARRRQGAGRAGGADRRCAVGEGNLLALSIDAMRLRATVGEVSDALEKVWGRHRADIAEGDRGVRSRLRQRRGLGQAQGRDRRLRRREQGRRPRVMIAKLGQDGHDRGAKVVATAFADLGFDVDIGPLFQTPRNARARRSRTTCTRSASARWPPATRPWCRRDHPAAEASRAPTTSSSSSAA
jgi:methylmalonyl-CoA mutase